MMKMANELIHSRIKRARAVIAAGVRLKQPALELKGRQEYAESAIENAMVLYGENLTDKSRRRLASVLFAAVGDSGQGPFSTAASADDDATADAEETTQELQALNAVRTPADMVPSSELNPETLYDPDDEFEDEDEPA